MPFCFFTLYKIESDLIEKYCGLIVTWPGGPTRFIRLHRPSYSSWFKVRSFGVNDPVLVLDLALLLQGNRLQQLWSGLDLWKMISTGVL
ncbi:hypothetical protein Tco_1104086 [Tanacetum coccineum]